MALRRHPVEREILRLAREGMDRDRIASELDVTPNLVWAVRYVARAGTGRETTHGQLAIARDVVRRWRRRGAAQ